MKVSNILENVINWEQRRKEMQARRGERSKAAQSQAMVGVDHVVAAAIDELKRQGMNDEAAYRSVMSHLSNLVMAFDLEGGMTD